MKKRRLAWAVWLAAAALLWFFENNAATLTLLAASVLLPLISLAAAKRRQGRVRLSIALPQSGVKGGEMHAVLSVEGLGVFSRVCGVAVCENTLTRERTETGFSFSPRLSGCSALMLEIAAAHCGTARQEARAWTEDLFGLWRSREIPCEAEFVVIEPELFPLSVGLADAAAVNEESERYSRTRPGSDPSETFAIREYIPGDPIRQIHWKLSQKTDRLMLRELGLPVVNRTLLVFRNVLAEGETVTPERADAMAEVFLSVSRALSDEGYAHTAAFAENGRYALCEVQGDADFRALETRLLTLSWERDDGALARLLAETPCAHAAIVSAAVPPDAGALYAGNRVTLLTFSPAAGVPGIYVVPFTAESYREELGSIEL